jgi:16S rRNA (uracil1498-N3)-methyltransferase
MSYFLVNQELVLEKVLELSGEEAVHILFSRRIKKGEKIVLQDMLGNRCEAEVLNTEKKSLRVIPKQRVEIPKEPSNKVSILQASVAESAWDLILQKSTELGVAKIYLFSAKNSPKQITFSEYEKKKVRWQKILWEAAKQSGRGTVPELIFLNNFKEVLEVSEKLEKLFLADVGGEGGGSLKYKNIGLLVGPEGGFTEEEFLEIKRLKNCHLLKLSSFTLRAETAAIVGAGILLNI